MLLMHSGVLLVGLHHPPGRGLISGAKLHGAMVASGLSEDILRSIWASCDPDGVGALNYQRVGFVFGEFCHG